MALFAACVPVRSEPREPRKSGGRRACRAPADPLGACKDVPEENRGLVSTANEYLRKHDPPAPKPQFKFKETFNAQQANQQDVMNQQAQITMDEDAVLMQFLDGVAEMVAKNEDAQLFCIDQAIRRQDRREHDFMAALFSMAENQRQLLQRMEQQEMQQQQRLPPQQPVRQLPAPRAQGQAPALLQGSRSWMSSSLPDSTRASGSVAPSGQSSSFMTAAEELC